MSVAGDYGSLVLWTYCLWHIQRQRRSVFNVFATPPVLCQCRSLCRHNGPVQLRP